MHELSNDEIDDMMIWPAPRLNESARHAVRSAYAAIDAARAKVRT